MGRLLVNLPDGHGSMKTIEEFWGPSDTSPLSVYLGGRTMPKAEVVICQQQFHGEVYDLWEPSPPNNASPLIGKRQPTHKEPEPEPLGAGIATKLELIVDRSGSMHPLHTATVQGLNQFLAEQRMLPHASSMTMRLTVFDDTITTCWMEGTSLVSPHCTVTPAMVQPRGQTALLDAIGATLHDTPLAPPRVVCIVTDGCENASRRFRRHQVNELITMRRNAGWTFIFLAANQDAIAEGATLGIGAGNCSTFAASPDGIAGGFGSASAASCRGSLFGSGAASFSATERAACMGKRR
jgi:hypothetical protein